MKKIKTAVVGVGYLGKFHAEKYASLPQSELVAVCDANPEQAARIAALHQVKALNDYRELVGQVEAISIASPTQLHYEIALFFLKHGIHVLVEKPISSTAEQAEELITVAKQAKLVLQVGHIERFNPCFKALQAQIKKPHCIEATRLAPFTLRGADVNVILDVMIHDIDLVLSIMQKPISKITTSGTSIITKDIDVAEACLEFDEGQLAFLKASRVNPTIQRELLLYQDHEYLHLNLAEKSLTRTSKASDTLDLKIESYSIFKSDALYEELNAFLNAVAGVAPVVVSGEDGFNALKAALEITHLIQHQWQSA